MWNILGREITPYAGSIWIAVFAAIAVFLWQGKRLKLSARIWTVGLGILLGLLGARLFYVLARWRLFEEIGWENFFRTQDEDLMEWGGAVGAGFWGGAIDQAAATAGGALLEADPCANSADFNFKLTDAALKSADIGDPRWNSASPNYSKKR